jgi:hypothetical protein
MCLASIFPKLCSDSRLMFEFILTIGSICRRPMRFRFSAFLLLCAWSLAASAPGQSTAGQNSSQNADAAENSQAMKKVPSGVILVKGAWSGASDSVTPVPEGGSVSGNVYSNKYFGMTFTLPADWAQKYEGPPPSENGRYVLAQIRPTDNYKGPSRGNLLITAQDMFFTPLPAANSLELTAYEKDNLQSSYKLERPPTETEIAGRPFTFFAYWSPAAEMHWYVLTTEIRCHTVEFVLTSRDPNLLESLMREMNNMELPAEANPAGGEGGGAFPVCIKDYAKGENLITRVHPILTEHRFNAVPVRIIIDKSGKVKHIHFLSAFPDQEKAITDALEQWRFKTYLKNGRPVEVETGIMFGHAPAPLAPSPGPKSSTQ